MQGKSFYGSLIWTVCFVASGIAQSQQSRTLIVDGHPGHVAVIEANGKSCVEIEALANLTNGSLSFNGNQIPLTLHAAPVAQPASQGFSKAFLNAGIESMSEIREWRSALQSAIRGPDRLGAWGSCRGGCSCRIAALRIDVKRRQYDKRATDDLDCLECFHLTIS